MSALTISNLEQTLIGPVGALTGEAFDLAIVAFGKSPRHGYLISQFARPAAATVVAITMPGTSDEPIVRRFERRFGASVVELPAAEVAVQTLAKDAVAQGRNVIHILVDVSCLSRVQMGGVFSALKDAAQLVEVRLSVGYCLARYSPPPDTRNPANRKVSPVHPTFSGWTAGPHWPVDVVVSLGYEKGKALGAVEYLEPNRRWIFVPNSPETKFLKAVQTHNRELTSAGGGVQIDYDVLRPKDTYFSLLSLIVGLLSEARPVLLPFGPRIFFAVSLLVAMSVEEAAVWHVDGEENSSGGSQQSSGHAVVMSCSIQR